MMAARTEVVTEKEESKDETFKVQGRVFTLGSSKLVFCLNSVVYHPIDMERLRCLQMNCYDQLVFKRFKHEINLTQEMMLLNENKKMLFAFGNKLERREDVVDALTVEGIPVVFHPHDHGYKSVFKDFILCCPMIGSRIPDGLALINQSKPQVSRMYDAKLCVTQTMSIDQLVSKKIESGWKVVCRSKTDFKTDTTTIYFCDDEELVMSVVQNLRPRRLAWFHVTNPAKTVKYGKESVLDAQKKGIFDRKMSDFVKVREELDMEEVMQWVAKIEQDEQDEQNEQNEQNEYSPYTEYSEYSEYQIKIARKAVSIAYQVIYEYAIRSDPTQLEMSLLADLYCQISSTYVGLCDQDTLCLALKVLQEVGKDEQRELSHICESTIDFSEQHHLHGRFHFEQLRCIFEDRVN